MILKDWGPGVVLDLIGTSGGGGRDSETGSSVLERKLFKNNHLKEHLCSRGLEPHFRVLFSAISKVLPRGISIRVETCRSERKQKCGKLWSIYVQSFYVRDLGIFGSGWNQSSAQTSKVRCFDSGLTRIAAVHPLAERCSK